jgi:hypothetical protein
MSDPKSDQRSKTDQAQAEDFIAQAGQARGGLTNEFVDFLKDNKKWWLAPIIISILGLGLLVMLGGTAAAPFIYTLF